MSDNVVTSLSRVLDEIAAERIRQDEKWGEQNHPNGTDYEWVLERDMARAQCEEHAAADEVTWLDILREEVLESFAETDPEILRAELVQVAAVAVAWVEAIDRSGVNQ